jgi:hypothetical protein
VFCGWVQVIALLTPKPHIQKSLLKNGFLAIIVPNLPLEGIWIFTKGILERVVFFALQVLCFTALEIGRTTDVEFPVEGVCGFVGVHFVFSIAQG